LDSRALVRLRRGEYQKAIDDYDAALQWKPNNAWSLFPRGIAKLRINKASEGEADIAAALKIAPGIADKFKSYGVGP
jgi:tetratricopeptide (TPR) repeat protein